jgi:hypothetical protein
MTLLVSQKMWLQIIGRIMNHELKGCKSNGRDLFEGSILAFT